MRIALVAAAAIFFLCGPIAAKDDNDIDDLTVITAQPRSPEVKMVVQTVPAPQAAPAEKPVKTAAK
jgi:hypothetical protein